MSEALKQAALGLLFVVLVVVIVALGLIAGSWIGYGIARLIPYLAVILPPKAGGF